jgi:hypothetical protein
MHALCRTLRKLTVIEASVSGLLLNQQQLLAAPKLVCCKVCLISADYQDPTRQLTCTPRCA